MSHWRYSFDSKRTLKQVSILKFTHCITETLCKWHICLFFLLLYFWKKFYDLEKNHVSIQRKGDGLCAFQSLFPSCLLLHLFDHWGKINLSKCWSQKCMLIIFFGCRLLAHGSLWKRRQFHDKIPQHDTDSTVGTRYLRYDSHGLIHCVFSPLEVCKKWQLKICFPAVLLSHTFRALLSPFCFHSLWYA